MIVGDALSSKLTPLAGRRMALWAAAWQPPAPRPLTFTGREPRKQ